MSEHFENNINTNINADINVNTNNNFVNLSNLTQQNILKTIGRNHLAPQKYTYCLKLLNDEKILFHLNKESNTFIGNYSDPIHGYPYIFNGLNIIANTEIWVINQEKQGYYYFWFVSKQEAIKLYDYINDKIKSNEITKINPIYKFVKTGWSQVNSYDERNSIDLIGYESYLIAVRNDLQNYMKYLNFLKSIGEGHRTLNYLLSGPPGTGKTTFIKTFGTIECLPIYIINQTTMDNVSTSVLLNPKHSVHKNKIVLFEDFDRYLKEGKFSMSEILNELDGIESTQGCIRFFTCNDVDEINKHDALINRMSAKFVFDYPTIQQFEAKLNRFLTFYPEHMSNSDNVIKQNLFLQIFNERNNKSNNKLTLRPFSNYIVRYLFRSDYMNALIKNIDELIV
mgnify:CR=1 FL=1